MGQKYPANASVFLTPPYSVFLSDYTSNDGFQATVYFNDFNESYWDVRFRITIENAEIRLQTKLDFIPQQNVRIIPGQPVNLTGIDLHEYFNPLNIRVEGIAPKLFAQNSKLPEGLYSFCLEVLDARTGKELSTKSCTQAWVQMIDPARLILPNCNQFLNPTIPQNTVFQWTQVNGLSSSDLMQMQYVFELFEITDALVEPLSAIANSRVLQIYTSEPLNQSIFLYDNSMPPMEVGKRYVWRIKSQLQDGKQVFKNNGYSEVCWFNYGQQSNGTIELLQPRPNGAFSQAALPIFRWSSASNIIFGEDITYQLKIVELNEGESPVESINKIPWYEYKTAPSGSSGNFAHQLAKSLPREKSFAWNVTAYNERGPVAQSAVNAFYGPSFIESFRAGMQTVYVNATYNNNIQSLNGEAYVLAGKDTITMNFQNISLLRLGDFFVLERGIIEHQLFPGQLKPIEILPDLIENGVALFRPTVFRVSSKGFEIKGILDWDFPHAIYPNGVYNIETEENWMDYNYYKITGRLSLPKLTTLPLLEPLGISMVLDTISDFLIDQNKYRLRFYGNLFLPKSIATTKPQSLRIPFSNITQTHYIQINDLSLENNFKVIANSYLEMRPTGVTLDLSDERSPEKSGNATFWKGLFVDRFKFVSLPMMDNGYQVTLDKEFSEEVTTSQNQRIQNQVDGTGWTFNYKSQFASSPRVYINTFPCKIDSFTVSIQESKLNLAQLSGGLLIPFIDTVKHFPYTIAIDDKGFQPAYLAGMDNYRFLYNKDQGENEIAITIHRGVFADNERVDINLTLEWKKLSSKIENLTGFSAWGNYGIGFGTPNGTQKLQTIIKQESNGYPMELNTVGAGSSKGLYAFGVSGTMHMGEDISGNDGPPVVSLYSLLPCTLLGTNSNPGYKDDTHFDINNPAEVKENLNKQITNFFAGNVQVKKQAQALLNQENVSDRSGEIENAFIAEKEETTGTRASEINRQNCILVLRAVPSILTLSDNEKQQLEEIVVILESISDEDFNRVLNNGFSLKAWFDDFVKYQTKKILSQFIARLQATTSKINAAIRKPIDSKVIKVDQLLATKIDQLVDLIADGILKNASERNLTIKNRVAEKTKTTLKAEVKRSFHDAVEKNITGKLTKFVNQSVSLRIENLIKDEIYKLSYTLIDKEASKAYQLEDLIKNSEKVFESIGDDVGKLISIDNIESSITNTGKDFVHNINIEIVYKSVVSELIGATIQQYAQEKSKELVDKGISSITGTSKAAGLAGDVTKNIANNVKFDFTDLGSKLKEGRIDKIVTFDPTEIKIETKIANIEGGIRFTQDDPVWGNSWHGRLKATIKMPEPGFMISCEYINGSKDDYKFWFIEVAGSGLGIPLVTIPLSLDGARGRVYHHMGKKGIDYFPDRNTKYGGSLDMYFYDTQSKGKTIRLGVGAEIAILNDGFMAELRGQVSVNNSDPDRPMVLGKGQISYNSVVKEFAGAFQIQVNAYKVLCGSGELGWNMRQGQGWKIWAGTEPDPIKLNLLCRPALEVTSFLELSNEYFAIGLGIHAGFALQSPWIGPKVARARAFIRAGFDFKASTKLIFVPLHIDRASIYLGAYVALGVDYESTLKDGSVDLVNISIYGMLDYQATPTSHLHGEIGATIEVIGIGFDMKFDVDHDL